MEKNLRCRLVPDPKHGGSLATALSATPAPIPIVEVHVLGGKWMSFRADFGRTDFGRERGSEQLVDVAEAHDTY
jgi:hypothetical protein